jgi:uncharacterized membrane protein YgcG
MARRRRKAKRTGWLEIAGVIAGVVFIVLCIGYVASAYWMYGLLADIAQKDFTPANQRLDSYRQFFQRLERNAKLDVEESPPYIKEGVKHFLWTVSIPGQSDRLIYHWQHDLATNKVEPLTSPATYVDIEYGYIRPDQASQYPYIVGDTLALQIAKGTYVAGKPEEEAATAAEPPPEEATTGEPAAEEPGADTQEEPPASDETQPAPPGEGGDEAAPGESGGDEGAGADESNGKDEGGTGDEGGSGDEGGGEEPPPDTGGGGNAVPIG